MNKHLLLIEDNHVLSNSLSIALKRDGFIVATAENGDEGLKKAISTKNDKLVYDLVITDINMPGWSGLQLIEASRLSKYRVNFLVITGYIDESILEDLYRNEVYDFLEKPFSIKEFLNKVNQCLQEYNKNISGNKVKIKINQKEENNEI